MVYAHIQQNKLSPEKADIPAALLHNLNLGTIMGNSVMKHIELTRDKFAIVNDVDFDWLNQWKWYAQRNNVKVVK